MHNLASDYIAELALIETSRQQREAFLALIWKPKASKLIPVYEPRKSITTEK